MLLSGYKKEIFRSKCHHEAEGVHCFAHLNDDISEVIPYLNAEMGGDAYIADPSRSLRFTNPWPLIFVLLLQR